MKLRFFLNDTEVVYDIQPDEYLAQALRRNGVLSIRLGCNESACGSCTVLVDDKPVLSCSVLAAKVEGKHVTTVEGIQEEANRIADFFADEGADQCMFCGVGQAMIIHALRKEYKNPTDDQIKDYLVGNLCRCSGYQSQFKAVKAYLEEVQKHE